jgi:hypothetical protein
MPFKCLGTYFQKTSPILQITLQKNPQGKPKNGRCAFQYEYRYVLCIHQGVGTHAFSCRFAFR